MNRKLNDNIRVFDKWAGKYDFTFFQFWMKKFHQPAFKEIDFSRTFTLLDLGCGTGEFLLELKKRFGVKATLVGIDISKEMVKVARKKVPEASFVETDVHTLPFPDNSFDCVISTEAFHHYYNQEKALGEMKRVVKNGGKVIIVDINFFFRAIHWLFQKFEPGCVKVNSRKDMRKLFFEIGLKNVQQQRSRFLFAVMTKGIKV